MKHAFLIHWHPEEAEALAIPLREAGWTISIEADDGARACAAVKAGQPDVVVISLARKPSHGRITGEHLASQRATREIPLLFLDGTEEAIEKTRGRIPSARFGLSGELVSLVAGASGASGD